MILKLTMQHFLGLKLYKVHVNDDPWLTFTYFIARSTLVAYAFGMGRWLQSLAKMAKLTEELCFFCIELTPKSCLSMSRGYIHVYDHYSQISSPKSPSQSKPILIWSLLQKRGHNFIEMVLCRHVHI